jgi:hypothetical protein
VNQLDDTAIAPFATGRPLEDSLDLTQCKHCKKSFAKTAAKAHLIICLKAKKEKAQRKKEQKEAREREKREMGEANKKDEDGDTRMDEDDDDAEDDASLEKKPLGGLKSAKKSAGKKVEIDDATKKGKKRKADGDAEKGPKQKKKKEEPKLKAPKPKGRAPFMSNLNTSLCTTRPVSTLSRAESLTKVQSSPHFSIPEDEEDSTIPVEAPVAVGRATTSPLANPCPSSSSRGAGSRSLPTGYTDMSPLGLHLSTPSKRSRGRPRSTISRAPANKVIKGPVDVERQCGVLKDGVPCARSLTCKSHSMGAKRAVPGRSLPYDMLLTAYQKKNQAKQQSTLPLITLFLL